MRELYSASAIERVLECPTSVHLPQVWRQSEDSRRGDSIHAFVRRVLSGYPLSDALALVDSKWVEICKAIDLKKLGGDLSGVRAEVAYAWHTRSRRVRELGVNQDRRYDVDLYEVPGTNDIEGTRMDEVPVVGDIKTGERVTTCEQNPQLLFHALARREATGSEEVQARIWYIGHDGAVNVDPYTFDRFDLDDWADTLAECHDEVIEAGKLLETKGHAPVNKGPWCKYCPAMQACPAYVGLALRQIVTLEDLKLRINALTPTQQGEAWVLAKQAETLAEAILEPLKKIAKQSQIPLADGSFVKAASFEREDFNRTAAVNLLRKKGANSLEISSLYKKHTVEQVRRFAAPKVRSPRKTKPATAIEDKALPARDVERPRLAKPDNDIEGAA